MLKMKGEGAVEIPDQQVFVVGSMEINVINKRVSFSTCSIGPLLLSDLSVDVPFLQRLIDFVEERFETRLGEFRQIGIGPETLAYDNLSKAIENLSSIRSSFSVVNAGDRFSWAFTVIHVSQHIVENIINSLADWAGVYDSYRDSVYIDQNRDDAYRAISRALK